MDNKGVITFGDMQFFIERTQWLTPILGPREVPGTSNIYMTDFKVKPVYKYEDFPVSVMKVIDWAQALRRVTHVTGWAAVFRYGMYGYDHCPSLVVFAYRKN